MALLKETGTKQFANCLIILQEQKKPIQSVMNGKPLILKSLF